MKKRPITLAAAMLCLGILFGAKSPLSFLQLYILSVAALALSITSVKKRAGFPVFLACSIFFLGGSSSKNSHILPKCHISNYIYPKEAGSYRIKGFVKSQPMITAGKTVFTFRAKEVESTTFKQACCGDVFVYMKAGNDFRYGQNLEMSGKLYLPYNPGYPGHKGYNGYPQRRNITVAMNANSAARILNHSPSSIPKELTLLLKQKLEKIFSKYASGVTAGILEAMVLGDKKDIPPQVYSAMIKSGTVHILVVSGFNVGIVALIIALFLKIMRLPGKMRIFISIPALIVYCLMAGGSTPVIRATIMALTYLCACLLKREPDTYNSCAIAAIIILAANPLQLFEIGFQLSFISVISIIFFYPRLKKLLRLDTLKIIPVKLLIESCLVSFAAWIGTMGLVAYYFKIFSPITIIANIFIVPLAALITLSGFSLAGIELTLPVLSPFFAHTTALAVSLLIKINNILIKLPGAYFYLP